MSDSADSTLKPKVFISYSWTNLEHESWVIQFANRLMQDGVWVVIDKWDLKLGNDANEFMEKMINDKSITHVLLICDITYRQKANERKGGVGTESQIISQEIYKNVKQEKFVPIIREQDDKGASCIPTFVSSRIYIDLSNPITEGNEYENLLRHLWNKPLHRRPVLGTMPSYLADVDREPDPKKSAGKVKMAISLSLKESRRTKYAVIEALDELFNEMKEQQVSVGHTSTHFDDRVMASINDMLYVRNLFVDLFVQVVKTQCLDPKVWQNFFEVIVQLTCSSRHTSSENKVEYDSLRFMAYELSLYYIALALKYEAFEVVANFCYSTFFYEKYGDLVPTDYKAIRSYIHTLTAVRNQRLGLNRTSLVADEVKNRATRLDIRFAELQEADCILYVISRLKNEGSRFWWPVTLVYNRNDGTRSKILQKCVSRGFFEEAKCLFKVKTAEELDSKVHVAEKAHQESGVILGYENRWVPDLRGLFSQDLCIYE